jgi:hypothetical protein
MVFPSWWPLYGWIETEDTLLLLRLVPEMTLLPMFVTDGVKLTLPRMPMLNVLNLLWSNQRPANNTTRHVGRLISITGINKLETKVVTHDWAKRANLSILECVSLILGWPSANAPKAKKLRRISTQSLQTSSLTTITTINKVDGGVLQGICNKMMMTLLQFLD